MPAVKTKSRKASKRITTFKLPKVSLSTTYSAAEKKHDEKVCLSRMKDKTMSQAQFDAAFHKAFGV